MSHNEVDTIFCRACCLSHYIEDCLAGWIDTDHPNRIGAIIALASMVRDLELEVELSPDVKALMTGAQIPLERQVAAGWA